jgi:hypothetical protein
MTNLLLTPAVGLVAEKSTRVDGMRARRQGTKIIEGMIGAIASAQIMKMEPTVGTIVMEEIEENKIIQDGTMILTVVLTSMRAVKENHTIAGTSREGSATGKPAMTNITITVIG